MPDSSASDDRDDWDKEPPSRVLDTDGEGMYAGS